jgi:hypothetical protein
MILFCFCGRALGDHFGFILPFSGRCGIEEQESTQISGGCFEDRHLKDNGSVYLLVAIGLLVVPTTPAQSTNAVEAMNAFLARDRKFDIAARQRSIAISE